MLNTVRLFSHLILINILAAGILVSPFFVSGNAVSDARAQTQQGTGLPVPRFVSLKAERVNMRIGPGRQFKVVWLYTKKGLPIEIIQEYDNWRKVRDPEGNEGWILHSLLSGKRTAIINPGEIGKEAGIVNLKADVSAESATVARIEPGVVANVGACRTEWCQLKVDGISGFVERKFLWGVYPDERIDP